jgi:hypothetical protein
MYQTTVVEIWSYSDPSWASIDFTGFGVQALDGDIGKVSEATHDTDPGHLIIDTGPWIFGNHGMLPGGVIADVDEQQRKVHLNLTKDQIKNAPEYDETLHGDVAYRRSLGSYYGANRPAGPDYGHDDVTHGVETRTRR